MKQHHKIFSRAHPLWWAFVVHRISGVVLALFIPLHFWVLALAMTAPSRLDRFLALTQISAAKLAEFGLVFLLAVHMFGGLRIMALEFLPWAPTQKTLAAAVVAGSFAIAALFFLKAI